MLLRSWPSQINWEETGKARKEAGSGRAVDRAGRVIGHLARRRQCGHGAASSFGSRWPQRSVHRRRIETKITKGHQPHLDKVYSWIHPWAVADRSEDFFFACHNSPPPPPPLPCSPTQASMHYFHKTISTFLFVLISSTNVNPTKAEHVYTHTHTHTHTHKEEIGRPWKKEARSSIPLNAISPPDLPAHIQDFTPFNLNPLGASKTHSAFIYTEPWPWYVLIALWRVYHARHLLC